MSSHLMQINSPWHTEVHKFVMGTCDVTTAFWRSTPSFLPFWKVCEKCAHLIRYLISMLNDPNINILPPWLYCPRTVAACFMLRAQLCRGTAPSHPGYLYCCHCSAQLLPFWKGKTCFTWKWRGKGLSGSQLPAKYVHAAVLTYLIVIHQQIHYLKS